MNVLPYFNQRPMAMLDGYREGDTVQPSTLGELTIASRDPTDAADRVYAVLNRDDRPNAKRERSLSVGDVVRVTVPPEHDGATGYHVWLACEREGWRQIEGT